MNDSLTMIPEFPAHEIKTLSQAYLAFCQDKHPLSPERCLHHHQPVAKQLSALAEAWQPARNEASWIRLLQCIQSMPDKSSFKKKLENREGFKADLTQCVLNTWSGQTKPDLLLKQ